MKTYLGYVLIFLALMMTSISCTNEKPKKNKKSKRSQPKSSSSSKETAKIPPINKGVTSSTMDPEKMEKARELIAAVSDSDVESIDGKKNYKKYCTSCHGFKGNAKINAATDLTKLKSSLERKVAQIYFGKGTMTPFNGVMEDAEIIAVAKYVETLRK